MKVFISWSGEQSSKFAKAFNDWLPNVFQSVTPFYSPEDIAAGERWLERLNTVLEEYDFGIVCLTSENLTAPWIMFESGALAKKLGKSKLVPVLCGVAETELSKSPLTQFQYVHTDKTGIRKLCDSIEASLGDGKKLGETKLNKAFGMWWLELEKDIENLLAEKAPGTKKRINLEDAVEEMLSILRSLARSDAGKSANDNSLLALQWRKPLLEDMFAKEVNTPQTIDVLEKLAELRKQLNDAMRNAKGNEKDPK
jgi:hypothetical protein